MKMKRNIANEIKTFRKLWHIEQEKWDKADSLGLPYMRYGIRIADGIILIIGAICKEEIEMFFISNENYNNLSPTRKIYLKQHYDVL